MGLRAISARRYEASATGAADGTGVTFWFGQNFDGLLGTNLDTYATLRWDEL